MIRALFTLANGSKSRFRSFLFSHTKGSSFSASSGVVFGQQRRFLSVIQQPFDSCSHQDQTRPGEVFWRSICTSATIRSTLSTDYPIDVVLPPVDYPAPEPKKVQRKVAPLIVRKMRPGQLVVQRGAICRVTRVQDMSRGVHRDVEVFFENTETGNKHSEIFRATRLMIEPNVDRVRYKFDQRDRFGSFAFSKTQLRKPGEQGVVASPFSIGDAASYLVPGGEYYLFLSDKRVVGIDMPRILPCMVSSIREIPPPPNNFRQKPVFLGRLQCGVEVEVPQDTKIGSVLHIDRMKNAVALEPFSPKKKITPMKTKMSVEEKEARRQKTIKQYANINMLRSFKTDSSGK